MEKIFLKEWIDERINCRDINYFDYEEFSNLETLYRTSVKRANWENRKITVVLKVLNNSIITDNDLNEFINKLKTLRMIYFHPNINRFFGIAKVHSDLHAYNILVHNAQIKNQLLNGLREDQIESTPLEYVQLYQKCWHDDPNVRPEINEIFKILSQLLSQIDANEKRTRLTYDKNLMIIVIWN
ncbi:unnamed protein product [Rhizophagus irregularis]|nr:unnamed protein product [Rhizophagus irregularis]